MIFSKIHKLLRKYWKLIKETLQGFGLLAIVLASIFVPVMLTSFAIYLFNFSVFLSVAIILASTTLTAVCVLAYCHKI